MTDRDLMKQALDAMESGAKTVVRIGSGVTTLNRQERDPESGLNQLRKAITALQEMLAQPAPDMQRHNDYMAGFNEGYDRAEKNARNITPPAAPDWQPIETAPKDGTLIVLGARKGVWLGKYLPQYQSGYVPDNPWSSMLMNHDHMGERRPRPTHWMPLPVAPVAQGEKT